MGAYIGVYKRFGSGDEGTNERRFEQVRSYVPALELAYREIAELKEKIAQENLCLEDEIRREIDFEGIVGQSLSLRHVLNLVETVASALAIMHELTARPVSTLIASEQMNLAGVREWTCRRKSDHWQAGHGSSRTSYITDEQYLRL